jgi:hypothetical protein
MATALNKSVKEAIDVKVAAARANQAMSSDEMDKLKAVVLEQIKARKHGMTGDNVDDYCFERSLDNVDIASICPVFYAGVVSEHRAYQDVVTSARQGTAYANIYAQKLAREKPAIESISALVRHYISDIKNQLREV